MAKVENETSNGRDTGRLMLYCPGCKCIHEVNIKKGSHPCWGFNGDYERPSLTPSVLVRSGHFVPGHKGECWCDWAKQHPDEEPPFKCCICHSFVTDGKIQFLSDCTHDMAGQTVDLPDVNERK